MEVLFSSDDVILQRLADYFGVRRVWLREGEGDREAKRPPAIGEIDPDSLEEVTRETVAAAKRAAKKSKRRPA